MDIVNLNNKIKIYSENQMAELEQLPFAAIRHILNNTAYLAFTVEYANQRYTVNENVLEISTFYANSSKYKSIHFESRSDLKNTLNKCKLNISNKEFNSALNHLVHPFFNSIDSNIWWHDFTR